MLQKFPALEEQLGKLNTDDPSVVEAALEKYSDLVYPDKSSIVHRLVVLAKFALETRTIEPGDLMNVFVNIFEF